MTTCFATCHNSRTAGTCSIAMLQNHRGIHRKRRRCTPVAPPKIHCCTLRITLACLPRRTLVTETARNRHLANKCGEINYFLALPARSNRLTTYADRANKAPGNKVCKGPACCVVRGPGPGTPIPMTNKAAQASCSPSRKLRRREAAVEMAHTATRKPASQQRDSMRIWCG